MNSNSNYEEIKEKSARIFPLRGMAEAAMKQGNADKALEYAKQFCDKADEIRTAYPDIFAAVVVYMNASEFLSRLLSDTGDASEAYKEQHRCLTAVSKVLVRGLKHENVCQTLLVHVWQSMLVLADIKTEAITKNQFDEASEILQLHFNLFYDIYYRLKRINPDNMLVAAQGKQMFAVCESMGLSSDVETPIDIDSTILDITLHSAMLDIFCISGKRMAQWM